MAEKKTLRQKLRDRPTPAEKALWRALRRSCIGLKFRRQHSVGRYVLDFYCPECKLAVELEGQVHFSEFAQEYEAERHSYLVSQGIRVLYFENRTVFEYCERVVETIRAAAAGRI